MQKKQSSLSRILSYAGGHKKLTLVGCILSALSAVLGLIPYVCVWLAARNVLEAWPSPSGVSGLSRWGWTAVWTAIGSIALYFAALMSTHIAAFRTARNIRRTAMAHVLKLPLGFFTGNQQGEGSVDKSQKTGLPDAAAHGILAGQIAVISDGGVKSLEGVDCLLEHLYNRDTPDIFYRFAAHTLNFLLVPVEKSCILSAHHQAHREKSKNHGDQA